MFMAWEIKNLFQRQGYRSAEDIIAHAEQISRWIKRNKKQPKPLQLRPLSPLDLEVKELAPLFLNGQYQRIKLVIEIMRRHRIKRTKKEVQRTSARIEDSLDRLKKRRLIPLTTSQTRPLTAPTLRQATRRQIDKHGALVHNVLDQGHLFVKRGSWQKYLSRRKAVVIGRKGLKRGIETHNPEKGPLEPHLRAWIASRIGIALRKLKRQKQKETKPKQAPKPIVTKSKKVDKRKLAKRVERLLHRPHYAMIYTLRALGHEFPQITHYIKEKHDCKVSQQAINQTYHRAVEILGLQH